MTKLYAVVFISFSSLKRDEYALFCFLGGYVYFCLGADIAYWSSVFVVDADRSRSDLLLCRAVRMTMVKCKCRGDHLYRRPHIIPTLYSLIYKVTRLNDIGVSFFLFRSSVSAIWQLSQVRRI